ncbi:MAG: hypothetical protein H0A75_04155 [Candidatus Methanofishera endochildressiae]|uniref:Uncharacterized protein n=1 Tax=Candidatus Methanofishera endochildressiae TaxID=2738884 RepID=A0A7Z0MNP9_9GAMM|nr:hypothetical protein [Candidatus Methanofishera endochildressiae]
MLLFPRLNNLAPDAQLIPCAFLILLDNFTACSSLRLLATDFSVLVSA